MAKQTNEPGPGRSTSTAAFNDLRKEIAQRNEQAHKEARRLRTAREHEQVLRRRREDLS
jgi:hypothetical protein